MLRKEILKLYCIIDSFSQNFVLNNRFNSFKKTNKNWSEQKLPDHLGKLIPKN